MKVKAGQIYHWYEVWETPADAWVLAIEDGSEEGEVIYGEARARSSGHQEHVWGPGRRVHCIMRTDNVKTRYVPPDEIPDEVCVALAKRALSQGA
jgi:hypothetical protein